MLSAVSNEIRRLAETFATLPAFVGFLPGMHEHVFFHVRLLMKSFPTIIARKRPDISVNQHVGGQGRGTFEMLSTCLALKYLDIVVSFSVLREAHVMAEGLTARDTPVRTTSSVRAPHVYLQTVRRAKQFLTSVARERIIILGLRETDGRLRLSCFTDFHISMVKSDFHVVC